MPLGCSFSANGGNALALSDGNFLTNKQKSIKRAEIDNKRVMHPLTMNNKDKYQSSSREEPPYTMYWVHKTI